MAIILQSRPEFYGYMPGIIEFLYHGVVLAGVLEKGKGKLTKKKNGSGDISPLIECLLS